MRPISRRTVIRVLRFRHDFFITSTLSTVTIPLHCTCPRCCTPCCTFLAFATALRDKLLNRRWSMPWFSIDRLRSVSLQKRMSGLGGVCNIYHCVSRFDHNRCLESRTSRKERGSALPYGPGLPNAPLAFHFLALGLLKFLSTCLAA